MKVYIRIDPLMDERKSHYSPAQLGAFVKVLLFLGRGSDPGRFRGSVEDLKRALPAAYAKHVGFLIEQGDLAVRKVTIYVDGWDEWQEGDLTVKERMAKLRARKKKAADVTADVTAGGVTSRTATEHTNEAKRDALTSTPTLTPTMSYGHLPEAEDVRLHAEGRRRDRPPDLDPLFQRLTEIGLFERSPDHRRQAARQLRAWGYGFEEAGRAWEVCGVMDNPIGAFAKAAQSAGRFKALFERAGPPPPPPKQMQDAVSGLLGMLTRIPKSTSRSPFAEDHR